MSIKLLLLRENKGVLGARVVPVVVGSSSSRACGEPLTSGDQISKEVTLGGQ